MKKSSHIFYSNKTECQFSFSPSLSGVTGFSIDRVRCVAPPTTDIGLLLIYRVGDIDKPFSINGNYTFPCVLLDNESGLLTYNRKFKNRGETAPQNIHNIEFSLKFLNGSVVADFVNFQMTIEVTVHHC